MTNTDLAKVGLHHSTRDIYVSEEGWEIRIPKWADMSFVINEAYQAGIRKGIENGKEQKAKEIRYSLNIIDPHDLKFF